MRQRGVYVSDKPKPEGRQHCGRPLQRIVRRGGNVVWRCRTCGRCDLVREEGDVVEETAVSAEQAQALRYRDFIEAAMRAAFDATVTLGEQPSPNAMFCVLLEALGDFIDDVYANESDRLEVYEFVHKEMDRRVVQ
jgi:hypothetical protein